MFLSAGHCVESEEGGQGTGGIPKYLVWESGTRKWKGQTRKLEEEDNGTNWVRGACETSTSAAQQTADRQAGAQVWRDSRELIGPDGSPQHTGVTAAMVSGLPGERGVEWGEKRTKERDAPRSFTLKSLRKRSGQTGREKVCGHGNPGRVVQERGRGQQWEVLG